MFFICDCDWEQIKAEYIAGGKTLKCLAQEHGISENVIRKRSAREAWTKDRHKVSTRVAQKVVKKIADNEADRIISGIDAVRYATLMWSDTLKSVSDLLKVTPEYVITSPSFLPNVANSLEKTYDLLMKMSGKSESQKKIEIDLARLKLDQARFRAEMDEKKQVESMSEKWVLEMPEGGDLDG